jgi:hypothetical protein
LVRIGEPGLAVIRDEEVGEDGPGVGVIQLDVSRRVGGPGSVTASGRRHGGGVMCLDFIQASLRQGVGGDGLRRLLGRQAAVVQAAPCPQFGGGLDRVDAGVPPLGCFVADAVDEPVVDAARSKPIVVICMSTAP